jgi:hypothetical protein
MDHAARRRLIYLLLRNGEIGGQPADAAPELAADPAPDEPVADREKPTAA